MSWPANQAKIRACSEIDCIVSFSRDIRVTRRLFISSSVSPVFVFLRFFCDVGGWLLRFRHSYENFRNSHAKISARRAYLTVRWPGILHAHGRSAGLMTLLKPFVAEPLLVRITGKRSSKARQRIFVAESFADRGSDKQLAQFGNAVQ